jgi:mono/diheme cytochrome c family protein
MRPPRHAWSPLAAGLLALAASPAPAPAAETPSAAAPVFEKDVLPLFQAKCVRCHGGERVKAGLDVRSRAGLLKGGESGPSLSPGSPERSELWIRIAADKMPPGKDKLSEAEKALVRTWIDAGARADGTAVLPAAEGNDRELTDADRQFWAFRSPARPPVPAVRHAERVRNPVDAFVLAALEKEGLTLAPEADRVTLVRRAFFDLLGLPPSPREVDEFVNDPAPDAYERLIDRLLASEHYGERYGRHWLDLAGYADSEGILDADYVRTAAWRYRDYVIQALNKDKPYDRFLKEQIAGDELVDYWAAAHTQKELSPDVVEALVATGYLRCASDTSRPDFVTIKNAPGYYYQTLDDTLKIVSSSVLGLTVQCARCHSHKYEPIPQAEYYRLQAIFMSAYRPYQWVPQVQRRLLEATEAQQKEALEHNARVDAAVAAARKPLAELSATFAERLFAERLARLPEALREDVRAALVTEPAKRTEVQKYLAGKFQKELRPDPPALEPLLKSSYPEYATRAAALAGAVQAEEAKRRTLPEIRALYDLPGEARTHLLRRGDYLNPGPEVRPGVLSAVRTGKPFTWDPPGKDAKTSGRRLAFAEWLTQPDHPLTARVAVNYGWLHHFGEGLVATPENFGHTGAPPANPELLDWLATEFVARGWSLKALHRLVMTSSTYRQASAAGAAEAARARQVDPDNHLLWRQGLRRLEAEALRDAMLRTGGNLNPQMFGPPVPVQRQADGEVITTADAAGARRSVYLQVRRSQPLTLLQVFDQPVMETNCTRRSVSTVSSQALTVLNSDFVVRQGDLFAARALREAPADPAGQALRLAFGRPATSAERQELGAFLDAQAARHAHAVPAPGEPEARRRAVADLCQMLLSANEFAYVD